MSGLSGTGACVAGTMAATALPVGAGATSFCVHPRASPVEVIINVTISFAAYQSLADLRSDRRPPGQLPNANVTQRQDHLHHEYLQRSAAQCPVFRAQGSCYRTTEATASPSPQVQPALHSARALPVVAIIASRFFLSQPFRPAAILRVEQRQRAGYQRKHRECSGHLYKYLHDWRHGGRSFGAQAGDLYCKITNGDKLFGEQEWKLHIFRLPLLKRRQFTIVTISGRNLPSLCKIAW